MGVGLSVVSEQPQQFISNGFGANGCPISIAIALPEPGDASAGKIDQKIDRTRNLADGCGNLGGPPTKPNARTHRCVFSRLHCYWAS
jgi:hypothetical protein